MPSMRCAALQRSEQSAAVGRVDVHATRRTASHSPAISGSGSMEPKSVVPAVATTAIGDRGRPRAQRSSSCGERDGLHPALVVVDGR